MEDWEHEELMREKFEREDRLAKINRLPEIKLDYYYNGFNEKSLEFMEKLIEDFDTLEGDKKKLAQHKFTLLNALVEARKKWVIEAEECREFEKKLILDGYPFRDLWSEELRIWRARFIELEYLWGNLYNSEYGTEWLINEHSIDRIIEKYEDDPRLK